MINVTDLRSGATFQDAQGIWEVVSYHHIKMGRGSATIRVKAKHLKTGSIIEKTFTSGQKVDDLEVTKKKGQYLYADESSVVFMDPKTYEQFSLAKSVAGGREKFLKEGEEYNLNIAEDQALNVEIPKLVVLSVKEAGPGVRGDTVSNVFKDAVLENGIKVKVPLFINEGEKIRVDTRTSEYVERVK
jgi:elongation factor P